MNPPPLELSPEQAARAQAIISGIMQRNEHLWIDPEGVKRLPPIERNVYILERFSAHCNMSGLANFFDSGIAVHYYQILEALGTVGADDMGAVLDRCKTEVLGDRPVPVDDIDTLDEMIHPEWADDSNDDAEPLWMDALETIDKESRDIRHAFERRHCLYALNCQSEGKLD
jgi:hypothetical protein